MTSHGEFSAASLATLLGRKPPLPEEWRKADEILEAAPRSPRPLDIARYLSGIAEQNADGWEYRSEWPEETRANPLVLTFFIATRTTPEGDDTPWCAAFVNWCLQRTGQQGTRSASSGSFRCKGLVANPPMEGDIAVFARAGHDEPCEGKGHVGFFLREEARNGTVGLRVLGGNQGLPRGAIKESWYGLQGSPRFLSVRQVASL